VFSSIAILLACVPLFDALRSSGPKRFAAIILAPLALFSLLHLAQAGWYCLGLPGMTPTDVHSLGVYFRPELLVVTITRSPTYWTYSAPVLASFGAEVVKWCIVLGIAVWLSIAQLVARWQGKKASAV